MDAQVELLKHVLTDEEKPLSLDDVHRLVATTWDQKSATGFWAGLLRLPLGTSAVMCYKALTAVNKLLHDGHPNSLPETYRQKAKLLQLFGVWSHQSSPYSLVVCSYVRFLVTKIDFHAKYQMLPGDLSGDLGSTISSLEPSKAFSLAGDTMDVQDRLTELAAAIIGSLNLKLSHDQTELRTIALVPLCQESRGLLSLTFHTMQLLHRELDLRRLAELDGRFTGQLRKLSRMYQEVASIKVLQPHVNLPDLPAEPPAFLAEGGIDKFEGFSALDENVFFGSSEELEAELVRLRQLIKYLLAEIERLKAEIDRLNAMLARMVAEKGEHSRAEARALERILEIEKVIAAQKARLAELEAKDKNGDTMDESLETARQRFEKMQEMYQKLRGDHLALLKQAAAQKKTFEEGHQKAYHATSAFEKAKQELEKLKLDKMRLQKMSEELQLKGDKAQAESAVKHHAAIGAMEKKYQDEMSAEKAAALAAARKLQEEMERMGKELAAERESAEKYQLNKDQAYRSIVNGSVAVARGVIQRAVEDFESQGDLGNAGCSPDYTIQSTEEAKAAAQRLADAMADFFKDASAGLGGNTVATLPAFSSAVADVLRNSKGSLRMAADEETSESIMAANREAARQALALLDAVTCKPGEDLPNKVPAVQQQAQMVSASMGRVAEATRTLIAKEVEDSEQLGGELAEQMELAARAISDAAKRLEDLLARALAEQSGLQLNVNESILGAAKALMDFIKMLVEKARVLQKEIVDLGRGGGNPLDFYRQNHTWTEGLISAAKAVGWGANCLVEAADEAVTRSGKFEPLIAAANEIMSSTAHLVAASRVKADLGSKSLYGLEGASTDVRNATREVVRVAKSAGDIMAESKKKDFKTLTDNQVKRAEMQKTIRVTELEKELEQVRRELFALRKENYVRDEAKGLVAE